MNRVKHLVSLISKLLFIAVALVGSLVFQSLSLYTDNKVDLLSNDIANNYTVTADGENNADLSYESGRLLIDLKQNSTDKPVVIDIKSNNIKFNSEFYDLVLKDRKDSYKEWFDAMEKGPWYVCIFYTLESAEKSAEELSYQIVESSLEKENSYEPEIGEAYESWDFAANQSEPVNISIIMADKIDGNLPSGKYYLEAKLQFVCDINDNFLELSTGDKIYSASNMIKDSFKSLSFKDLFNISSLGYFYGILVIFGMFFFLWKDVRTCWRIGGKVVEKTASEGVKVFVKTFVNGSYQGERVEYQGFSSGWIQGIFVFLLAYFVLLITTPIRIIVQVVTDIIYLFADDYRAESTSIIGSILGSVGIYAALYGVLALIGQMIPFVFALITLLVGVALIVVANIVTNRLTENYVDL